MSKKLIMLTYCSYSYGMTDSSELSLFTNNLMDDCKMKKLIELKNIKYKVKRCIFLPRIFLAHLCHNK